nr:stress response protein NST1-like [Ipomoea batatas]
MKITGGRTELPTLKAANASPGSDLLQRQPSPRRTPRRRIRSSGAGVRLRKDIGGGSAGTGRRSRPQTPLLRWKFNEDVVEDSVAEDGCPSNLGRKCHRKTRAAVSVRQLAAGIWRLQLPEVPSNGEKLGFQGGVHHAGIPFYGHHHSKAKDSPGKDSVESPRSVSGPRNGAFCQLEPSFQFSNTAMEGVTKWDPISWKATEGIKQIHGHQKVRAQQTHTPRVVSVLEAELEKARARVSELETEQQSYKKKIEQFLKKLSEERAAWRSREHEKIRIILDDMKADLTRERKNRQRLEIVNSKLVNELADAKLSAKRFMQDYEKERKARDLIEEVCDELAKEIGEDKAEVELMKREGCYRWLRLIADLESFLSSRGATPDMEEMKKVEHLRQLVAAVNIHDIREFTYEPPNPDDIFAVFEDASVAETNERQIEPHLLQYSPVSHSSKIHTVSPDVNMFTKDNFRRHPKAYINQSDGLEDDGSEWETVSHLDEQGSSYSPDGSDPSVNKNCRLSTMSRSGADWEGNACDETPITDISEVCSSPTQPLKKMSSISRLWRYSNGRLSNGAIMSSPDRCSSKDGLSPSNLAGQWNSPDLGNPHLGRGANPMEGIIVRRVIPSDNSCLFNAVGYVMDHDKNKAPELRQVIAAAVASDPTKYSEAFLGKPNQEYCEWILNPEKWGGAIELSILAEFYGREIAAYDIQTTRCDLYGQENNYHERVMLIYDGLHYDALASSLKTLHMSIPFGVPANTVMIRYQQMSPSEGAPEEFDQTIFTVQKDRSIGPVERLALNLVKEQQRIAKWVYYKAAMHSISILASIGNAATWYVALAGAGDGKSANYFNQDCMNSGKFKMEMPREAKGLDGDGDNRRKLAPAIDAKPAPKAIGARPCSLPRSIAGIQKLLAAPENAIDFLRSPTVTTRLQ